MSQAMGMGERTVTSRSLGRRRVHWGHVVRLAVILILSAIFSVPFVWLLLTALKSFEEINAYPIQILPSVPQWENFTDALTRINYAKFAWNSTFLSTASAVLTTMTSALVGFGFARLRGWGRRTFFMLMLSTLMLPPIITLIPSYIIYARLGLTYTYWPWIIGGLGASPIFSFLFRQFFANLPTELEDAAIVDGCGYGRIFWQLFLPLSKPVMATVAIFTFQGVWNDYIAPNLYLDQDNTTLAVAMQIGYTDPTGSHSLPQLIAAGNLIYALPVFVLFFAAQRYFVQGIVTTGLKG
jgi:ABC-type glycerol-3-phosphate transport system permease component